MAGRVVAYIDGFNLYYGLLEEGLDQCRWLDLNQLISKFLKPGQTLLEVKYFTSRITNNISRQKRQTTYIEALQATGVEVIFGQFQNTSEECRFCGSKWLSQNEKMTDVNTATHLLVDAFQDRYDTALLISGDSDLVPPILEIHRLLPQKSVVVFFPPKRRNKAVALVAKGSLVIGRKRLKDSQLPDVITNADGYELQKPDGW
jgi:uncharacterized LabA/DUF88 family protein